MKKVLKRTIVLMLILFALWFISSTVYAAEAGTTMHNPINIEFGEYYTKSWTKSTDHLFCFNEIKVTSRGILNMKFSKPFDAEGEYGKLTVIIYDLDGEPIWGSEGSVSVETASSNYIYNVGLDKGTYYVTIKPNFSVRSGVITTDYTFSFKNNNYCEIEPNESGSNATLLQHNNMYQAYLGNEYSDYGENDYYKFQVNKGMTYKVVIGNYGKLDGTTTIIHLYNTYGEEESFSYDVKLDSNGNNYYEFVAEGTGVYYIHLYNYIKAQIPYTIGVYYSTKPLANCNITLSYTKATYNGKTRKPDVRVITKDGSKILLKDNDYTVSYSNNKETGKATVKITGKGNYSGTVTKSFIIIPSKVNNVKVKDQSKSSIKLEWRKNDGKVTGYKIYNYNNSKRKWEYVGKTTKNSYEVKKLKAGTTYKYRISAYKTVDGTQHFGAYSSNIETCTKTKTPKISKIKSKSKNVTVNWKKVSGASGYEIYMSTSKNGKYSRVKTIKNAKTLTYTKKDLKKKKTYYFKIRTYRTVNGKKVYSSYSNVEKIKIK